MTAQPPLAAFWLAAAESGFARREAWADWADAWIAHTEHPPNWIIDLSLATSLDDLWRILTPQIDHEVQQGVDRIEIYDAVLGYLWLRLERGDIDLQACLELAGRHADAYDTSVACEAFFALLNNLEGRHDVYNTAMTLFAPFRRLATQQWTVLSSCLRFLDITQTKL